MVFVTMGCGQGESRSGPSEYISKDSVLIVSSRWKSDSMGCKRLRDPEKIMAVIRTERLIGRSSGALIQYLGRPNHVEDKKNGELIYYYHIECGEKGSISYDNFYCYFSGDSLLSYVHKVF